MRLILSLPKRSQKILQGGNRMKRFLILMVALFLVGFPMAVMALNDKNGKDDKEDTDISSGLPGGGNSAVKAEDFITKIKERKEKILQKIRQISERMPERLKKLEERANKRAGRFARGGPGKGDGAKSEGNTAGRGEEFKAKVTEKYEAFKKRLSERKTHFDTNSVARREKIAQKISKMKAEDNAKVLAEFDAAQKEIAAEIEKLIPEATKKLDETYQNIISKIK